MNKFKGIFLLMLPLLLTGCWDSVELNERHIILEVALDKNPDVDLSEPIFKRNGYRLTYAIPDIGKLSGEDSLAENVKTNIITNSPSIATSIDKLERKTQNTITLSHTKALILGEELLKDKDLFKAALDALLRDMKVGRSVTMLATKGMAGDLTQEENPQNPIMGMYIMKYFNNRERGASYAKEQLLGTFTQEIEDTGVSTIPIITSDDEANLQIGGAALIKDYALVDWLDEEVVRGTLFTQGQIKRAPIAIEYKGQHLTYMIKDQTSKISFKENQGEWECVIDLVTEGDISEYLSTGSQNIFNTESIQEITALLQNEIEKQVAIAIKKSQELSVDFLGIGLEMYRKHPEQWKNYKETWENTYSSFPIHVNTTTNIQNTGVLQ